MVHLGDIKKIDGAEIEPVDVIIGGSPCTQLSIAGSREGLNGEESGLFFEQIRIIKEMRKATNGEYPKFMVWENVPGAFTSHKGNDFATVLNEIISVINEQIPHISVPKNGWSRAGSLRSDVGGGFSIAWRTFDAQYFGLPQRRKRIALIADFRGFSAAEILFERKSVPRDFSQSKGEECHARQKTGADPQEPGSKLKAVSSYDMTHACNVLREYKDVVPTLQHRMGTGGNQVPLVIEEDPVSIGNGQLHSIKAEYIAKTLDTMHDVQIISYRGKLRRITPVECERLQGFPDNWTDIGEWVDSNGKKRKSADSLRYRSLGNSIAIPQWEFILKRLCQYLPKDATMGSLFDGIGGFPLVWEKIHDDGSLCRWGSEIEEFPMAITKKRFGTQ